LILVLDAGNIEHLEEAPQKPRKGSSKKLSEKVLELIVVNNEITIPEIAIAIGVSERTVFRCIQSLQKDNILGRSGSKKTGKWIII